MKQVLVLLSSYNGEKYIDEQLDSLFNQNDVAVHLIIRDDGSKDNTVNLIKNRKDKGEDITLIEGENLGFAMSFMFLVEQAYKFVEKYEYFAFCDQDDVWLPQKLISAIMLLEQNKMTNIPNLYWSNFTLVDQNLNPIIIKEKNEIPVMTKPTILVRYFMLGCTMVFDGKMVEFIHKYQPKGKLTMHDLWLSQTAIFFGNVIYDNRSFLLYRQHGINAAGVDNSWKGRFKRLVKSFKTYERRHFREINAKNLLSTYENILTNEDYKLINDVANYRNSIRKKIHLLLRKDISMGSFVSDILIKVRIIIGLL